MTVSYTVEPNSTEAGTRPGRLLRHCLGHFATGVTIVSYRSGKSTRGLTINSFTAVSLDPPLVLICLDRQSAAFEIVPYSDFAVNFLHADQENLATHFAGRPLPNINPQWRYHRGVPLLSSNLAWLICEPWSVHDAGDHRILVGRVTDFDASEDDPLCFFRGRFLQLDDPSSPRASKN